MKPALLEQNGQPVEPINRYPDEPHPDDEHAWKAFWVKKCFKLDQPLTQGEVRCLHQW